MIGSGDVCKWPVVASYLTKTFRLTEEVAVDIVNEVASFKDPARGKYAFDRCESPAERLFLMGGAIANDFGVAWFPLPGWARDIFAPLQIVGRITIAGETLQPFLFQQFEVAGYRADFAVPLARLLVEVDGHEFHSSKQQLGSDKQRDRRLTAEGWRVIRFTGSQVFENPARCFHELCDIALSARLSIDTGKPFLHCGFDMNQLEASCPIHVSNDVFEAVQAAQAAEVAP